MSPRPSPWSAVLAGGLLAGALDILYACLFWAVRADPTWIALTVAVHAFFVGVPIAWLASRADAGHR